jgi:hypothetical protein
MNNPPCLYGWRAFLPAGWPVGARRARRQPRAEQAGELLDITAVPAIVDELERHGRRASHGHRGALGPGAIHAHRQLFAPAHHGYANRPADPARAWRRRDPKVTLQDVGCRCQHRVGAGVERYCRAVFVRQRTVPQSIAGSFMPAVPLSDAARPGTRELTHTGARCGLMQRCTHGRAGRARTCRMTGSSPGSTRGRDPHG